jgi:hypothetical protein
LEVQRELEDLDREMKKKAQIKCEICVKKKNENEARLNENWK